MILVDAPFLVDLSMKNKTVSIIVEIGVPPGSPLIVKLIAEKIVTHEEIASRVYETYKSGLGGTADDNWFCAERQLLSFSSGG